MARFQSHQGVRFYIRGDVIGDLEVPDHVPSYVVYEPVWTRPDLQRLLQVAPLHYRTCRGA